MAVTKKKEQQLKLGEILVQHGVVTTEMLQDALRRQSQVGGHLAAILMDLGSVTLETILECLSRQFGVPATNLFNYDVPRDVIKMLPIEKIQQHRALPLEMGEKITVAMVNPKDVDAIQELEFILGRSIRPVVVASLQMDAAIKALQAGVHRGLQAREVKRCLAGMVEQSEGDIAILLTRLSESNASDLQLTAGVAPSLRMGTELHRLKMPALQPDQVEAYAKALMTKEQQKRFEHNKDIDFALTDADAGRCRVNIYRQRGSVSITVRRIVDEVQDLGALGLPRELEHHALKPQGLILITGPAGQGKSTTLACLVDIINTRRRCNIVSLEDPIEFLHGHKNSNVNQREIGLDTNSFYEGLKHIYRQSPDVIVVGEMRDSDSFQIALQAAETGHLVLSTLHSRNTTATIERIIDIFPPHQQTQIRNQLADLSFFILSQRLLPSIDKTRLVLACEKLKNSVKVKNFIRDGKTNQIRTQMQMPVDEYVSIDVSLARLCIEGKVSVEDAVRQADNVPFFRDMVKRGSVREPSGV